MHGEFKRQFLQTNFTLIDIKSTEPLVLEAKVFHIRFFLFQTVLQAAPGTEIAPATMNPQEIIQRVLDVTIHYKTVITTAQRNTETIQPLHLNAGTLFVTWLLVD